MIYDAIFKHIYLFLIQWSRTGLFNTATKEAMAPFRMFYITCFFLIHKIHFKKKLSFFKKRFFFLIINIRMPFFGTSIFLDFLHFFCLYLTKVFQIISRKCNFNHAVIYTFYAFNFYANMAISRVVYEHRKRPLCECALGMFPVLALYSYKYPLLKMFYFKLLTCASACFSIEGSNKVFGSLSYKRF